MTLGQRIKQILIALDQLGNTLVWAGDTWADETLSSHAYREHPRMAKIINILIFWQDNHCHRAYVSERDRLQLPPEFRP